MEIRKSFSHINNMHIVRNCSSERCKKSLHSHSYQVEIFLTGNGLDDGFMIYDFGLMKGSIKDLLNCFNNSYTLWDKEPNSFKNLIKSNLNRVVELPVSPSAESFSVIFFKYIEAILNSTKFNNNEKDIKLVKVNVHETRTGYASCDKEFSQTFGENVLEKIKFSDEIINSLQDKSLFDKIFNWTSKGFINPVNKKQIDV